MIADKYIAPATGATINRIVAMCVDEAEAGVYRITPDEINKPGHYILSTPATDVLDVLKECGFDMGDHYVASAIAYLCRCKKKNQYKKDLQKAAFYVNKAIELYEAEERRGDNDKQGRPPLR